MGGNIHTSKPQQMPLCLMRRRHRQAQQPHTTDTGVRSGARRFSGSGRQVSWFTLSCPHNGARAARAQGHLLKAWRLQGCAGCNHKTPSWATNELQPQHLQKDLTGGLPSKRHKAEHDWRALLALLLCMLLAASLLRPIAAAAAGFTQKPSACCSAQLPVAARGCCCC